MPELRGSDVMKIVYDFAQRCFVGQGVRQPLDLSGQEAFFEVFGEGPLSVLDAHRMNALNRRILYELLTQYIMFLQINQGLPFPPDFLEGSSKEQLGPSVVNYMREHRWPFPQLLAKQSR